MKLILQAGSGTEEMFVENDSTIPRRGEYVQWDSPRDTQGLAPGRYKVIEVVWLFPEHSQREVILTLEWD